MISRTYPALDRFRLLAAILVVCNHTSPLEDLSSTADFLLTRVLARIAVPFFLMVSGYFLSKKDRRDIKAFWKKTLLLYTVCVFLYFPLNLYAGQIDRDFIRRLVTDGSFYHLWYFPALLLGVPIARALLRLGLKVALPLASLLYLIGLGGDSYYGLVAQIPLLREGYGLIFHIFSYTRNGLFFVPLFLLLGAAGRQFSGRVSFLGLLAAFAGMVGEALWLHRLDVQRHDSMYLFLPLVMVFLFSLLLHLNRGEDRQVRRLSMLVYLFHPWGIVTVRFGAELANLEGVFVTNSVGHFCAVLVLTTLVAVLLTLLWPRPMQLTARAWREIDLDALAHNAAVLQESLPPGQRLMAVVKADAYGHGATQVCRRLWKEGIHTFAVACLAEGIALRKEGIRGTILILGYTAPEEAPLLHRWWLTQAVVDVGHGEALNAQGKKVQVHLALDTGMHRLGIPVDDWEAISTMYALPNLKIKGIFSHLCVSDSLAEKDIAYTKRQTERFFDTVAWMREQGFDPGKTHIQASYGIWNLPPQPCAYARAGIALYGIRSGRGPVKRELDLMPVLSLRARVAQVQRLKAGEGAGYGLDFQAERNTVLAVVTVGYGDGLPRELSQRGGEALIHGFRCPMVGRMCMDQLFLDVTGLPDVAPGDVVTILGTDGEQAIRAEEMAGQCNTITNELLSQLRFRLSVAYPPSRSLANGND